MSLGFRNLFHALMNCCYSTFTWKNQKRMCPEQLQSVFIHDIHTYLLNAKMISAEKLPEVCFTFKIIIFECRAQCMLSEHKDRIWRHFLTCRA